ncbi:MAG: DedA family protein [Ancalomicrobiaceae bacterium]|nr:DedA family protein [Ancalomicrobiaceae bacterium]
MTPYLEHAVADYGLWAVGVIILVECLGVPAPGQAILLAAAIFAGMTGGLDISAIVIVAAAAAFAGGLGSFALARLAAVDRFITRHGHRVRFGDKRRAVAQRLFARYGAAIVFLGRFVAVLRTFSGLIAGIIGMPPVPYILANLLGSVAWASVIGFGGYLLGDSMRQLSSEIQWVTGFLVIAIALAVLWAFKRYERRLDARSEADDSNANGPEPG